MKNFPSREPPHPVGPVRLICECLVALIACGMPGGSAGRRGYGATSPLRVNAVGVDIGIYVQLWISKEKFKRQTRIT